MVVSRCGEVILNLLNGGNIADGGDDDDGEGVGGGYGVADDGGDDGDVTCAIYMVMAAIVYGESGGSGRTVFLGVHIINGPSRRNLYGRRSGTSCPS